MKNNEFGKQFACRLRKAMVNAGFNSERSSTGVDISKLVEITGYSPQICRKYLKGQVIPEPAKLIKIAMTLNVSPGWLLFGEYNDDKKYKNANISINKELLQHIFIKASPLYETKSNPNELADFLLEVTSNISNINAEAEESKKIIELAISSTKYFNEREPVSHKKRPCTNITVEEITE